MGRLLVVRFFDDECRIYVDSYNVYFNLDDISTLISIEKYMIEFNMMSRYAITYEEITAYAECCINLKDITIQDEESIIIPIYSVYVSKSLILKILKSYNIKSIHLTDWIDTVVDTYKHTNQNNHNNNTIIRSFIKNNYYLLNLFRIHYYFIVKKDAFNYIHTNNLKKELSKVMLRDKETDFNLIHSLYCSRIATPWICKSHKHLIGHCSV